MRRKYPKAFPVCFISGMCEMFVFMMLSIVVIFVLIQRFELSDSRASLIVGSFTAMLYISSVLAGQIADRLIGYYRSIILGGGILVPGYIILTFATSLFIFCIGLSIVCCGTGLLKTNIGSYLGKSYDKEKHLFRQAGFTVFFVGMNIGALFGNFYVSYLFNNVSEKIIFVSAALIILTSILVVYFGFKIMKLDVYKLHVNLKDWLLSFLMVILGILLSLVVIYIPSISMLFFFLVMIVILFICFKGVKNRLEFRKSLGFFLFLIVSLCFWCLYKQIFITINLFIERVVDHKVFGFLTISTQSFILANVITIILSGIFLNFVWKKISLDIIKNIIGMLILIFTFVSVNIGIYLSNVNSDTLVSGNWIIFSYILIAFAELCISPIGLSLATRLASEGKTGSYMSLWFVNTGLGSFIAGFLAQHFVSSKKLTSIALLKQQYQYAFDAYSLISIFGFIFAIIAGFFIYKILGNEA